jgi:hypothetical protein
MPTVILHVQNEDPVVGELDHLPGASDTMIFVKNPRRRDGKDVHYLEDSINFVIWPLSRLNFIEIMTSEDEEEIITHVRE